MQNQNYRDFSDAIKSRRKELGISQRELSRRAHISPGYMARIENDDAIPGHDIIQRLSEELGFQFVLLNGLAQISKKSKRDILEKYPKMIELFQRISLQMKEREIQSTFKCFENRIVIFSEDQSKLATNFRDYFKGQLKPTDKPANGTRPLCHYWIPWSKELSEWEHSPENNQGNNGYNRSNQNNGEQGENN